MSQPSAQSETLELSLEIEHLQQAVQLELFLTTSNKFACLIFTRTEENGAIEKFNPILCFPWCEIYWRHMTLIGHCVK
jgi:hypothetical protein